MVALPDAGLADAGLACETVFTVTAELTVLRDVILRILRSLSVAFRSEVVNLLQTGLDVCAGWR
jgi:hypothetical protein